MKMMTIDTLASARTRELRFGGASLRLGTNIRLRPFVVCQVEQKMPFEGRVSEQQIFTLSANKESGATTREPQVMVDQFKVAMRDAIRTGAPLTEIASILGDWRDQGLSAASAAAALENLRHQCGAENEDRVLQTPDIVTGFCRPELQVWKQPE